MLALLLPNNMAENFPRFPLLCFLLMLLNSCLDALAHSVTEVVGFSFLSSNVLKNLANCCCRFVMKKLELDLVDSNSVRNHTSDYQTRTNARTRAVPFVNYDYDFRQNQAKRSPVTK